MAEKAPHSRFNPNESWLEGRGSWLTYGLLVCLTHFAILSIPFIDTATAWTLTSIIHCLATYYFLHYLKGNPFENSIDGGTQGKDRRLTHWEQINQGAQNTSTKKFMTLVPVVIFILASFYTKYDLLHFIINTGALASALVPKLPQLHKCLFVVLNIVNSGASSLGSVFHPTKETESIEVVHEALRSGINYIDVAPWYGHGKAEKLLGKALKDIPRSSYFIATKVGRYLPEVEKMFDFSSGKVIQGFEESLARLGLDYVDVLQVHDMEFAPSPDIILNETLPALQKLKESGKVRFIGITGYPLKNFSTVLEKSHVPVDCLLSYCHCAMNDHTLLQCIEEFKRYDVGVINAAPISMGLLSNRGPPSWHPATQEIRNACKQASDYCQSQNVDISKLAMHFSLGIEDIATTLVSTASIENLKKNLDAVTEELSDVEKTTMNHIIENYFNKLENKTWEGVEVQEYWRKMDPAKNLR